MLINWCLSYIFQFYVGNAVLSVPKRILGFDAPKFVNLSVFDPTLVQNRAASRTERWGQRSLQSVLSEQ